MKKILLLILILPVIVQAADTELQDLAAMTTIVSTDVLYIVDDPAGTPASRKITALDLFDMIDTFAELLGIVTDKTLVNEEDAVTWDALGTFALGITITTGDPFTLGAVRWDNGSDLMNGEQIADDTIDDDSIDWSDCTFADFEYETNWRMWHSNGVGDVTEITLGANGTFLESNGAAAAPAFRTLASGDIPDISGTYEVQLVNEAGLYSVLSDVTNFLQSSDIDSVGELAGITDYETGSGALVFGTAPTFTTSIQLTGADADPAAAAGTVVYDNTITGIMSGGGLRWYDDNSVRLIVDLETDPSNNDYVVAYDSTADGFYMKVDAGAAGGDEWGDAVDSDILPTGSDNIYDLGSVAASFKDGYFQGTLEAGTLTEGGNAVWNSTETDFLTNEHIDWANIDYLADEGALTVIDSTYASAYVAIFDGATGNLQAKTDGALTYDATSGTLAATQFSGGGGSLTGVDAATGDAAVDFFGAGVDAVTDATTCTDIEGTGLSIGGTTLNWAAASTDLTDTAALLYETELDDFSELQAQIADKTLVNTADGATWSGTHDFGGANLEIPQATPAVPSVDGEIEFDFTDGSLVIQHGSAHTELGSPTDVVIGKLIRCWGGTIFEPDAINDVMTVKAINSIEFPHGVVITAIYLGVSENTSYTLTVQNFDDFDTINGGAPTIDAVTYTANATGEIIDTSPTYDTIAAGQLIMISIPATDVDWIHFEIYYYEPAA